MSNTASVNALPVETPGLLRWSLHLGLFTVLLAVSMYLYRQPLIAAYDVWVISPTFQHCFLVVPIAAWLAWRRLDIIAAVSPSAEPLALLLFIPILALWLVGTLTMINELQQFAFVAVVQILLLATLGRAVYRQILFPALFLFFLVPTGAYLITPLQNFTASFMEHGLRLTGIPFYREGTILTLPDGKFEVAEACAGLRFLIATIELGVLFSGLTYRKWYKVALFILASCFIPVIANGFRALAIVLLAYMSDNTIAVGFDHVVYGWGFSVAILMVLFIVGSRYRDSIPEEEPQPFGGPENAVALIGTAVAAVALLLAGPASLNWMKQRNSFSNPTALAAIAAAPAGWSTIEMLAPWRPVFEQPDRQAEVSFVTTDEPTAPPVLLSIDYYAGFRDGHQLVAPENQLFDDVEWHSQQSGTGVAKFGETDLRVREELVSSFAGKRLIWSVYWIDGHYLPGGIPVKLLQLYALLTGRPAGALIALSSTADDSMPAARARLAALAATLDGLSDRLSQASQPSLAVAR